MPEIRSTARDAAQITSFVLAGGQSRRMGRDKAMLDWRGQRLLDHMTQLLSTVADPVQIIGRGALPDRIPNCGPLGEILTALEVSQTPKTLIVAIDLPLLTPAFLQMFRSQWLHSTRCLLACRIGADYPLCLGVDRALAPEVAGRLALREWIADSDTQLLNEKALAAEGFSERLFANANTPEEWESLLLG